MMHRSIRTTTVPVLVTALAALSCPAWAVDTLSLYTVNLTAPIPIAAEGDAPGEFLLERTGSSGSLTVYLTVGTVGEPVVSADSVHDDFHLTLPGSGTVIDATGGTFEVPIADGVTRQRILVYAHRDFIMEGAEDVQVSVAQSPTYIRGPSLSAYVTIADVDAIASLSTPDPLASEYFASSSSSARFRLDFNNWILPKNFTSISSGVATLGKDHLFGFMPIHYPSGGELYWLSTGASASVVFTNQAGSVFKRNLRGSGWYVNEAPTVSFDYPTVGVQSIENVPLNPSITSSGFDPEDPPIFVGPVSSIYHRPAIIEGVVDPSGTSLLGYRILDPGIYQCSRDPTTGALTTTELSAIVWSQIRGDAGTPSFGTCDVSSRVGSRATGEAVINGIVTSIPLPSGSWTAETSISITGGEGTGATAEVVSLPGSTFIRITNPGSGYRSQPNAVLTNGTNTATVLANIAGPILVNITNAGLGYTTAPTPIFSTQVSPTLPLTVNGIYAIDGSAVNYSLTPANPNEFPSEIEPLDTAPAASLRRSDGPDIHRHWQAKSKETARTVNKRGSNLVEVTPGNGVITCGDAIQFDSDLVNIYIVTEVELPIDSDRSLTTDSASDYTYVLHLSSGLAADVSDDTQVRNLLKIDEVRHDLRFGAGLTDGDMVGFLSFDHVVDPLLDTQPEGMENVELTLVASPDFALQEPTMAEVNIADDDVTADIQAISQASEPALSGLVRVTLSAAMPKDISLAYQVMGSATPGNGQNNLPGADYVITGLYDMVAPTSGNRDAYALGSVTIPAGTTFADIEIATLDDNITEGPETVTITLQQSLDVLLRGSASSQVNPSATVNITDKVGTVGLVSDASMPVDGAEGTSAQSVIPAQFKIRLTASQAANANPPPLGIGFRLDGTATYGADYILDVRSDPTITFNQVTRVGSVVLDANGTGFALVDGSFINTKLLTLTVFNDALIEGDETVIVTLLNGSGYSLEEGANQTLKIADDLPAVTIRGITGGQETGTVSAVFEVSYDGGPRSREITILYAADTTVDRHADLTDVVSVPGSVKIPAGQSSARISLLVVDDNIVEGEEQLGLQILEDSAYKIAVGKAAVNLADNEPSVSLVALAASATEGGSPVVLRVSLSGIQFRDLSVPIVVSGTATSGQDYVAIPTSVTIKAGELSKDMTLSAKTDTSSEPTETVIVTLAASTSYSLGSSSSAAVSILDANGGPVAPPDVNVVPSGSVADGSSGGGGCGLGGGMGLLVGGLALVLVRRRR